MQRFMRVIDEVSSRPTSSVATVRDLHACTRARVHACAHTCISFAVRDPVRLAARVPGVYISAWARARTCVRVFEPRVLVLCCSTLCRSVPLRRNAALCARTAHTLCAACIRALRVQTRACVCSLLLSRSRHRAQHRVRLRSPSATSAARFKMAMARWPA